MKLIPLDDSHIPLIKDWLSLPHVSRWFSPREAWLREIEQRKTEYAFIRHFIAEEEHRPIGFCQDYDYTEGGESWHGTLPAQGSYSIDYFIGNPDFLGKGFGTALVRELSRTVFAETKAKRILVQPEKDNRISRRTLLSAGYLYDDANDVFLLSRSQ